MDTFNFTTSQVGTEVTSSRWKAAYVTQAFPKELSGLASLVPLDSINPIVELHVTVNQSDQELEANQQKYFVTTVDNDADETNEEWMVEQLGGEVQNAFDLFED